MNLFPRDGFLFIKRLLGEMASDVINSCVEARKGFLGPFSPSFDPNLMMGKSLERVLPEDVHLKVSSC